MRNRIRQIDFFKLILTRKRSGDNFQNTVGNNHFFVTYSQKPASIPTTQTLYFDWQFISSVRKMIMHGLRDCSAFGNFKAINHFKKAIRMISRVPHHPPLHKTKLKRPAKVSYIIRNIKFGILSV